MYKTNIFLATRSQGGVSLLQLMVTVAIAVILTGTAVPSFASLLAKTRVTTQNSAVIQTLSLARSYAVSRQQTVHICQLDPTTNNRCDQKRGYNSDWSHGWLLFADGNANNEFDHKDELLRIVKMPETVNIVFNQRGRLRFFPDGRARSAGFYLCDQQSQNVRHVYLLHTGRTRTDHNLSARQKSICKSVSTY